MHFSRCTATNSKRHLTTSLWRNEIGINWSNRNGQGSRTTPTAHNHPQPPLGISSHLQTPAATHIHPFRGASAPIHHYFPFERSADRYRTPAPTLNLSPDASLPDMISQLCGRFRKRLIFQASVTRKRHYRRARFANALFFGFLFICFVLRIFMFDVSK